MNFSTVKNDDKETILNTYARYDLCIVSGKGAIATDINGREYIDFGSGIGVNSLGYSDEGHVAAVTGQLGKVQHTSNLYYTLPQVELAKALVGDSGFDKVFFSNSGAEANECAIKIARKYSADKYSNTRCNIIVLEGSFHGRTITTLSATGQVAMHQDFHPLTDGFLYVTAGDIDALKTAVDGTVCAVMFEPIQGEGGVVPLDKDYVAKVAELCRQHDLQLIFDDVQTGAGRTGKLFAYEYFGEDISPDIVTLAKGLGGGLPIGACLSKAPQAAVMTAGTHGSTFGGNPAVCAGAVYVLNTVNTPEFLASVAEKGEYIKNRLLKMQGVKSVRGMGLMIGIELLESLDARSIAEQCIENGLIVLTAKTLVRLLPPLNISKSDLDKGLAILNKVLGEQFEK